MDNQVEHGVDVEGELYIDRITAVQPPSTSPSST